MNVNVKSLATGLSLGIGLSYLALKSDQESWLAPQEAVTAPQDNDKKATVSHGRPPAPLTPFPTPTKPNTSQKNPRPTILAGNWKCNPSTLTSAKQLISSLNQSCPPTPSNVKVIIAFPSLFLSTALACMRDDFIVAAQDSGAVPSKGGAYTGEASPTQLVSLGVTHVVLGHSERREGFQASANSANSEGESSGESSLFVASKVKLAVEAGMTVLLCVGEKKAERENGTTMDVVASQLAPVVAALEPADWANVIIAYEPVWAIGTGLTATPEMANATHHAIRIWLSQNVSETVAHKTVILYGGSMNGKNAEGLLAKEDIDGGLIGGASLKPEFSDIVALGSL